MLSRCKKPRKVAASPASDHTPYLLLPESLAYAVVDSYLFCMSIELGYVSKGVVHEAVRVEMQKASELIVGEEVTEKPAASPTVERGMDEKPTEATDEGEPSTLFLCQNCPSLLFFSKPAFCNR